MFTRSEALGRSFEKLERRKQTVLSDVGGLSPAQARFQSEPAAWSALEVLDHLVKVERGFLEGVRKALPHGAPVPFLDRVKALAVIAVMQSPIRVKVPTSALTVLPEAATDLTGIVTRWDNVRHDMADLIRSLDTEQLSQGVFRHPVSGWMTMPRAITFLSAHIRHHRYQLQRIKWRANTGAHPADEPPPTS